MKLEQAIQSTRFKDETHKATLNLLYTAYWLKTQLSDTLKGMGLTAEQYNVMRIIKGKHPEPMCVKDIAGRMIEKSSNVPRIIDRLVTKKLVKRSSSKEDRRETLIALTDKGVQQLTEANVLIDNVGTKIIGINNDDSKKLNELLEKLRNTV
jgi:DNA-binding MarR family transcriptional regulator